MPITEREIIEAAKFYLNKLITENDSKFIIVALEKSTYNVKKEGDTYKVKSSFKVKEDIITSTGTFSPNHIEIFINEENRGIFNDHEIVDSSFCKERYALYDVKDNIIDLKYKQSYVYNMTTKDGTTSTLNPINYEDAITLEFINGENNLLTNYLNIKEKSKDRVLTK
ncbi:MAG: hypothetical protein IJL76_03020 [Bacilli bacterium]|nr:hypothetical protein [Bacilli bacterium]